MHSPPQESGLVRGMGLTGATAINIANIIGTGVFLKARVMTCNVESAGEVLMVWAAAGLLVLAGSLTYGELAAMLPKAGGEYVFLREAYGQRVAFLYGWTYIFIARGGALAAQAVGAAIFFNIVTGGLVEGWLVVASISALALVVIMNCATVALTGRLASVFMYLKVALVGGVGLVTFLYANGDWLNFTLSGAAGQCQDVSAGARGGLAGFGAAMLAALWGYQGWANVAPMAGEVRDPARNMPRAFILSVLVVGTLYLFANASYFYAMSPNEVASVASGGAVASEALRKALGPVAASLLAMGMLGSSFTALHTGTAAVMRMPYALAIDGLFFKPLARLSERRVPAAAAVFIGAWASILCLTGNYDQLTDYAVFALWLFYGLTAGAVFVLRKKLPEAHRPYRTPGYPFLPGLFIVVTILLLLNTLFTAPVQSFSGLGLILLGLPFYAYWNRRRAAARAPIVH